MERNYYSQANIEKRRLARERAIAWKVIKMSAKTFLYLAFATGVGLVITYHILVYTIDQQIDQSNIRDCQDVKELVEPGQWAKLQDKCQSFYSTGEIEYMRKWHDGL